VTSVAHCARGRGWPGGRPAPARRTPKGVVGALVALTKPRIIELLLVTTVPTMLLASAACRR
jgi:protoheme IX farnesyltransferase